MAWQEDDVVHALAGRWRRMSTILAAGGSQIALSYIKQDGGRKAPDLVAYLEGVIIVVEAKVQAGALFAGGDNSDFQQLSAFVEDETACSLFAEQVCSRLQSMGLEATHPEIRGALLAGTPFPQRFSSTTTGMTLIHADPDGRVKPVAGSHLLPATCIEALD